MYFNDSPSAVMQQNNKIDYKNFYVIYTEKPSGNYVLEWVDALFEEKRNIENYEKNQYAKVRAIKKEESYVELENMERKYEKKLNRA